MIGSINVQMHVPILETTMTVMLHVLSSSIMLCRGLRFPTELKLQQWPVCRPSLKIVAMS